MNNLENPHSTLLVSKTTTFPFKWKILDTDSQSLFGVVTAFSEEKLSDQVMPTLPLCSGVYTLPCSLYSSPSAGKFTLWML